MLSTTNTPVTPQNGPSHSGVHNVLATISNRYFTPIQTGTGLQLEVITPLGATHPTAFTSPIAASIIEGTLANPTTDFNSQTVVISREAAMMNNVANSFVVTISHASPGVVSATAHGLVNGNQVYFSTTGTLPAPLAPATFYYVVAAAANTFELSLTSGGTPINTTTNGSGTHTAFPGINDNNAALQVYHANAGAIQPVAIKAWAADTQYGDSVAFYGITQAHTGRAYGYFCTISVDTVTASTTPGAIGFNPSITNLTGVDATFLGGLGVPFLCGYFLQANSNGTGKLNGSALQVADTSNLDVGLAFRPGSVVNQTYRDESTAVTSIYVGNTHGWGADFSPGTYTKGAVRIDATGVGDNGFVLDRVSSDEPYIGFDSGDFISYFRTANQYQFNVASVGTLFFGTSLLGFTGLPNADPGVGTKQFWYDGSGVVHYSV